VLFLVRLVILVYGFYTTTYYFQSYIGLAIGAFYFLLFRNPTWRLSGLVLAWTAGVTTVIINVFSAPEVGSNISANLLAMIMGPIVLILYIVLFGSWRLWQRHNTERPSLTGKLNGITKKMPKYAKVAVVLAIVLVPTALWWSVSINLGVMFDNNPRLLWVHTPTTIDVGSSFPVSVEAWDPYERLSAVYTGTVQFSVRSYNLTTFSPLESVGASLPAEYTFSGQAYGNDIAYEIHDGRDNGLHVFTARIDTPGIHYILVNDSVTMNTYWSNPIIVSNFSSTDPKIYWGDFHGHSVLSDGTGTPEHHYYYARYVACLDICALTDHGETMQFELGALDHSVGATNAAYDPGTFVTLQGVEWTQTSTGHYTCIFSGDSLPGNPIISYMTLPTTQDLWNVLDAFTNATGCQALALPHHTTKLAYIQDWTYLNPKYVKIVEVTSVHGESLFEQRDPLEYNPCGDPPPVYTPGTCIMDAFKMGYRMTLYASGDNHDGHPGHSLAHTDAYIGHQRPWTTWPNRVSMAYPSGITAVYAVNLTRTSVFDGLENERIFASSDYGRPFIDFTVNGAHVGDGSTLKVTNASVARQIRLVVAQDGAPAANVRPHAASVTPNWVPDWHANVEIFKNGNLMTRIPINAPVANITLVDTAPVAGTSYGVQNCVQIDGQYYINIYSDNPINPSTLNTGGADFYLIRVVGQNGRTAYAGPLWVEVSP
jgi:hypothetical protein